jgi:hypothetical protein
MFEPPVECSVCERCTCYCAKSVTDVLFEIGDEKFVLKMNVEKIRERENYLRYLREELERKTRQCISYI